MQKIAGLILVLSFGCIASDEHHHDDSNLFESAFEQERDSKTDSTSCSGVKVPDRSGFNKVVALTFDDGPNPDTTPEVMETLRRFQAPATFFINGRAVNSPETERIVEEIVQDDLFLLGNHTWSHKKMPSLSARAASDQISDATTVIEAAGGEAKWFRFPYGLSNCQTADEARSQGYTVTGWHIDSADWCFSTRTIGSCPESQFRYVDDDLRNDMAGYTMRQIRRRGGGVVLFHDVHRYTTDSLEPILEMLVAEGYSFTNLDDTDVFPLLNDSVD